MDSDQIKQQIENLLPDRSLVFSYIWDRLNGPLAPELDRYLKEKIGDYGSWKERYRSDGKLAFCGWIYRRRKQGHWRYYYRSGQPHRDCFYRNNVYQGTCTEWEEDGAYEVCEYYKGKPHGELARYDRNGELRLRVTYQRGQLKI